MENRWSDRLLAMGLSFALAAPVLSPVGALKVRAAQAPILLEETGEEQEAAQETLLGEENAAGTLSGLSGAYSPLGAASDDGDSDEQQEASASGNPARKKMTLMVYGVGSDLEHNSFFLTSDMIEMAGGLLAARGKNGLSEDPLNIVVETGGVTFERTSNDKPDATVTSKVQARAENRRETYGSKYWEKIDRDIQSISSGNAVPETVKVKQEYSSTSFVWMAGNPSETNVKEPKDLLGKDNNESVIDWTKNQRWVIEGNDSTVLSPIQRAKNDSQITDLNRNRSLTAWDKNGVVSELYDFVSTTMASYPADQYALVLWDHGGGSVGGFASDERDAIVNAKGELVNKSETGKGIYCTNLKSTLDALKTNMGSQWKDLAFIGFDACLMADMDTLMTLNAYTDYVCASEDLESGDGWYYVPWIANLSERLTQAGTGTLTDTAMVPITQEALKANVDGYIDFYTNWSKADGTLGVFEVSGDKVSKVDAAAEKLFAALKTYMENKPTAAFHDIFEARSNAHNFNGRDGAQVDLRTFCGKLMEMVEDAREDNEDCEEIYARASALRDLLTSGEGNLVRYFGHTGTYKDGADLADLCGLTNFLPYRWSESGWGNWMKIYKDFWGANGRTAMKDFMLSYAAIQSAGELLRDITLDTEKYKTEEAAEKAISDKLRSVLSAYSGGTVPSNLAGIMEGTSESLYEGRLRGSDLQVLGRNNRYYSQNQHWDLIDDLYLQGQLVFSEENEKSEDDYLGFLYLGFVPEEGSEDEAGTELTGYRSKVGFDWFYATTSGNDDAVSYPVSVYDVDAVNEAPFTQETIVTIPGNLSKLEKPAQKPAEGEAGEEENQGSQYEDIGHILVDVQFLSGANTGKVLGYRRFNEDFPNEAQRFVPAASMEADLYFTPIYNVVETARRIEASSVDPTGKLKRIPLTANSTAFHRGKITDEMAKNICKELLDHAFDNDHKITDYTKVVYQNNYKFRDMFGSEYYLEEPTKYQKATVMIYAVGSDLEREGYAATYDMTEIVAGLEAARAKAVKAKTWKAEDDLPISVVVETGGVSYADTVDGDKVTKSTSQKIYEHDQERWRIHQEATDQTKYEKSRFAIYDRDAKALAASADHSPTSYSIFEGLTKTMTEEPYTNQLSTNEAIEWDKNQRYELHIGKEVKSEASGDAEDSKISYLTLAKNSVSDGDMAEIMTQPNKDGVVPELYEFVNTTMRDYPAEQYILVLWDHAGGPVDGFGTDERDPGHLVDPNNEESGTIPYSITSENVVRTFDELKKNGDAWKKLSLVSYDSCVSAGLENALAWSAYAEYLLASEDNMPNAGQYYLPFIAKLTEEAINDCREGTQDSFGKTETAKPILKGAAEEEISHFIKWYKDVNHSSKATLALIDLEEKGLKKLTDALDSFAEKYVAFLQADPVTAYKTLYDARFDTIDFSTNLKGMMDLGSFAHNIHRLLYPLGADTAETPDPKAKAAMDAAEALAVLLEKREQIVAYGNTDNYEKWTDAQILKGMTVLFPFVSGTSYDSWSSYLKIYGSEAAKSIRITDHYRDLVGSFISMQKAGSTLKLIYDEAYETEDRGKSALREEFNDAAESFGVTPAVREAMLDLVEGLYDKRITKEDTDIIKRNDRYYHYSTNRGLQDGVSQHGQMSFSEGDKETVLGLGYLPGGKPAEDGGDIELVNYKENFMDKWIYLREIQGDDTLLYPASVFDAVSAETTADIMTTDLLLSVPALLLQKSVDKDKKETFNTRDHVMLNIVFDKDKDVAQIVSYTAFEPKTHALNGRTVGASDFTASDYIVPIYNVEEVFLGKQFYDKIETLELEDKYLLTPLSLQKMQIVRGDPADWKGENEWKYVWNTIAEDSDIYSNLTAFSTPYVLKDIFGNEYDLIRKTLMVLEARWANDADRGLRLQGSVLKPAEFAPYVQIDGRENEEETEKYAKLLQECLTVEADGRSAMLDEKGYTIPDSSAVLVTISEEVARNPVLYLTEGYDEMTDAQQAEARATWSRYYKIITGMNPVQVKVVRTTVSAGDERSGMDPQVELPEDGSVPITLVKGQKAEFGAGNWTSEDKKIINIGKKNGKATAKAATAQGKTVKLTNGTKSYQVAVVDPKLCEVRIDGDDRSYETVSKCTTVPGRTTNLALLSSYDAKDRKGEQIGLSVAWVSSAPAVATVDSNGKVTAIGKGSAKISAYVGGKAFTCSFKVVDVFSTATGDLLKTYGAAQEIMQDGTKGDYKDAISMNPGTSVTLKYGPASGFNPKSGVWEYRDKNGEISESIRELTAVAGINGARLTARAQGSIELWGYKSEEDKSKNKPAVKLLVDVVPVPAKSVVYLNEGRSETLRFYKVNARLADFWSIADSKVVQLDARRTGKLTAQKLSSSSGAYASTEVTCTSNGSDYTTMVYVEKPELDATTQAANYKITKDSSKKTPVYSLTLKKGTRYLISMPWVRQSVNWKSSKPAAAFVDENGVITGRSSGKATVSAKINGTKVQINVTVN